MGSGLVCRGKMCSRGSHLLSLGVGSCWEELSLQGQ